MIARRILIALGVLAALFVVAWFAVFKRLSHIGAGYAAQQTCACLFISGRPLESCRLDLDPLAQKLVSLKPGDAEVIATSFGLASATGRYDRTYGCSITN